MYGPGAVEQHEGERLSVEWVRVGEGSGCGPHEVRDAGESAVEGCAEIRARSGDTGAELLDERGAALPGRH